MGSSKSMLFYLAVAICLVAGIYQSGYAQSETSVKVQLSRDTIGLDEQAVLQVMVAGPSRDLPAPNLPTLPMFELYSQGQSSNLSIANGRVSASVTYRYLIIPTKAGTFPIENIAIVYQNKRYRGNSVTLTVVGQPTSASSSLSDRAQGRDGKSKDYFLEAIVDDDQPYVNQQVTFTLKFYTAVQYYGSPELAEPTTTGFWTEILGNKAPYRQKLNNRTYRVIERKYALFPTKTGELEIGRSTISITIRSRSRKRRDPFDVFGVLGGGEQVNVHSAPITINVRPLPVAGRPDSFSGTIGRFNIKATATKREVEVNQPVSVNIAISGIGNIKSVAEPTMPDLPDFRIYRASSNESISKVDDHIGGTKTFEEVFIPKRPGILEIPALSFNFFDPQRGRYQTVSTKPITLTVKKTEGYAAVPDLPYSGPDLTIGAESRDIRYIKADPGDLQPPRPAIIGTPLYLAVNASPLLALLGAILIRRRRDKFAGDIGYARARRAVKEARRRLAQAKKLAAKETAPQFYGECSQAVLSFLADKMNVSPHGLTTDSLALMMRERQAGEDLVADTAKFLNSCDFGRFAPGASGRSEIDRVLAEAEALMVRMEEIRF